MPFATVESRPILGELTRGEGVFLPIVFKPPEMHGAAEPEVR